MNNVNEDIGSGVASVGTTLPPNNPEPVVRGIDNAYTRRNKKKGNGVVRRSAVLEFKEWLQIHTS